MSHKPKIYFDLFKEMVRPLVHPIIYRQNKALLEERKQFYASFLKPGNLVFDVGANLGNRVEAFLAIGCKVVAVEPQGFCRDFLKTKFGNQITLLPIALGEKPGQLPMFINAQSSTLSSLSTDWIAAMKNSRFKDNDWQKTEMVEVNTLDNLIQTQGLPHFVKIDVEGFELEVLKGLTKPIPFLSLEYTTPEQTQKLLACLELLSQIHNGYCCNYSVGESNRFATNTWDTIDTFRQKCATDVSFLQGFGDVYIQQRAAGA